MRISVSLGSVLDTRKLDDIYYKKGQKAFLKKLEEIKDENGIFRVGPSLGLIKVLSEIEGVEIALISKFTAEPELMLSIAKSINHHFSNEYGFNAFRQNIFTNGEDTTKINKLLDVDLAITTNEDSMKELMQSGVPAIQVPNLSEKQNKENYEKALNGIVVISDFDGVIADSSSESVFQKAIKAKHKKPEETFAKHEAKNFEKPMEAGPLMKLIKLISDHQKKSKKLELHIVTARSGSVLQRAIISLAAFKISAKQMWFMSGYNKNIAIESIITGKEDKLILFLDDGAAHFERASEIKSIISGLVASELK